MKIRLPLPAGFSFDAVVRSHGWYNLPPFVYDRDPGILNTTVEEGGEPAAVAFELRDGALVAKSDRVPGVRRRALAVRIFSLDLDLSGFASSLAGQPHLVRAFERGGRRMLRAPSLFEDAVKMLFTTNCSWGATRGMVTRLIEVAGRDGRAFPGPDRIARLTPRVLHEKVRCGYRSEALLLFARRVAQGRTALSDWEDRTVPAEDVRGAITAERGFGPYAAEGLLRILGRHDYLALDSWTRQQYRRLYPGRAKSTDGSIARRYARFGANKGLALWLDLTREWHEEAAEPSWP